MGNDNVFTPQGDLRENIGQLVGYDGVVGRPAFVELKRRLLRICTLPLSRKVPERDDSEEKDMRTRDFLTGLYLQQQALFYIILSQEKTIKVMFGLPHAAPSYLKNILRGAYPGILVEEMAPEPVALELRNFPFCAAVQGVPSPKEENGMDKLLYGLGGNCWAYAVIAHPLDDKVISHTMEKFAAESQRVKNAFLRSYTTEQDNNPLAQYYLDLLKAALEQYKVGQIQGCWASEAFLLSSSEASLASGMAILASIFCGDQSLPAHLRVSPCVNDGLTSPRPTILNTTQLSSLVQLPLTEMPGYQVIPSVSFASALPERRRENSLAVGKVIQVGRMTGEWWEMCLEDLTKHTLVTGVTGSGKTETCHFILDQLWREYGIPYLVIEPAKKEYLSLRHAAGHEMLTVFSPSGVEATPLRLNPFEIPQKTAVQTHIDSLRCLFNASFAGLYPPMPYLLEEALYRVYQKRGWNIANGQNRTGGSFPTLNDFCAEVEDIALNSGYDRETTQNVSTSLRVRLNSWRIGIKGLMLNTPESTPFDLLLTRPAVVELGDIADAEVVSFVMGLVLIRIYEHLAVKSSGTKLNHVVLIEESHRLLARGLDNSSNIEVSNIRGQAVETFCNMLAEVRAYGEGFIIVDQSPTKLHLDAIKGTNLKIVHRLVAQDDRCAIGGSANMSEEQQKFLAVLSTGEAVVYAEGFHQPYLVKVPEFRRYAINRELEQKA
jgi:hypothetical protein